MNMKELTLKAMAKVNLGLDTEKARGRISRSAYGDAECVSV